MDELSDSSFAVSDRRLCHGLLETAATDKLLNTSMRVPQESQNRRQERIVSKIFLNRMERILKMTALFAGLDLLKSAAFIKRDAPTPECAVGILSVFAPGTSFTDVSMYLQVSEVSEYPASGWTFRNESQTDTCSSIAPRSFSCIEAVDSFRVSVVGEFRSTLVVVTGALPTVEMPDPPIDSISVIVPFKDAGLRDDWATSIDKGDSFTLSVGWYEDPTGFSVPTCLLNRCLH